MRFCQLLTLHVIAQNSYGINGKQAPLVGFLPLESTSVASNSTDDYNSITTSTADGNSPTPTSIAALSLTTTLQTALPNAVLPDPTFPTPTYVYSATPALLQPGAPQYLGLANSSAYEVMDVPVISVDNSAVSSIAVGNNGGGSNVSDDGSSSARAQEDGCGDGSWDGSHGDWDDSRWTLGLTQADILCHG